MPKPKFRKEVLKDGTEVNTLVKDSPQPKGEAATPEGDKSAPKAEAGGGNGKRK